MKSMMIFFIIISTSVVYADLSDSLVAHYPFNGNANDESGNGYHGNVIGAILTTDRFGSAESAYHFDGNDYINIGDNLDVENQDLTLCVWVKANSYDQYAKIINKGQTSSGTPPNSGFSIRFVNDEWGTTPSGEPELRFSVTDDSGDSGYTYLPINNLNINAYTFIVGTFSRELENPDELKLFVNGVAIDTTYINIGYSNTNIPLAIGVLCRGQYGEDDEFFVGDIDDVRIYHRALSENEISQLHHIGGWMNNPENVNISISSGNVELSWDSVHGATSYKVYSSDNPETGFTQDTNGSFVDESWSAPATVGKKFYYVVAVN